MKLRLQLLLLISLQVAGCASKPPVFEQVNAYPRPTANSSLTCLTNNGSRCALTSPLQAAADALLEQNSTGNNEHMVTMLDIGIEALELRLHLIRAARESIELQTFIWANDETGYLMYQELLNAAKRGVKVRIIADQLYSVANPDNAARVATAHENLEVKLYNPLNKEAVASGMDKIKGFMTDFSSINHRMHNKLLVFDNRIAVTGGRNIENKYYDLDPQFDFVDRDVLVIGPEVKNMVRSFNEYWQDPIAVDLYQLEDVHNALYENGKQRQLAPVVMPDLSRFDKNIGNAEDSDYVTARFLDTAYRVSDVMFSADRPQKPFIENVEADQRVNAGLANAITGVERTLTIQTPYFLLSKPAFKLLQDLRKEKPGLEYRVSTNSLASTDHYFVYALSFKRKKRNIDKLGFNIFELKPNPADATKFIPDYQTLADEFKPELDEEVVEKETEDIDRFETMPSDLSGPRLCIHAKSIVVDSQTAIIGSHNFDPRSIGLNTELTLTIRDDAFAQALEERIMLAMQPQNSWVIAKRQKVPFIGHISGFFASISRALPVFDIWPFRYTSSYELKSGKSPLLPGHPDFYEHYNNVGQFPGTRLGDEQMKTILVSGFGAVAEPLL